MPEDADEIFVFRVKSILREDRLKKEINFRQLEVASGISHGYLALAERSNIQPTLLVFRRWTKGLGLELDDVIKRAAELGSSENR